MLHGYRRSSCDLPEIVEMDLNPVFVLEKGAVAADIRVRVGADLEPRLGISPGEHGVTGAF